MLWQNRFGPDGESAVVRFRRSGQRTDEAPEAVVRPSGEAATLAWCKEVVRQVNSLEAVAQACADDELKARTAEYRERLSRGESAAALVPEAFATVREAARRAIGLRHHAPAQRSGPPRTG